jgi:hypothetical protein
MELPRTEDLPEWLQEPTRKAGAAIRSTADGLAMYPGPLRPMSMMVPDKKVLILIDLLRGKKREP